MTSLRRIFQCAFLPAPGFVAEGKTPPLHICSTRSTDSGARYFSAATLVLIQRLSDGFDIKLISVDAGAEKVLKNHRAVVVELTGVGRC